MFVVRRRQTGTEFDKKFFDKKNDILKYGYKNAHNLKFTQIRLNIQVIQATCALLHHIWHIFITVSPIYSRVCRYFGFLTIYMVASFQGVLIFEATMLQWLVFEATMFGTIILFFCGMPRVMAINNLLNMRTYPFFLKQYTRYMAINI